MAVGLESGKEVVGFEDLEGEDAFVGFRDDLDLDGAVCEFEGFADADFASGTDESFVCPFANPFEEENLDLAAGAAQSVDAGGDDFRVV